MEIIERAGCGKIMGGLGGAMDHHIERLFPEKRLDGVFVAYVTNAVFEICIAGFELGDIPPHIAFRAEEVGPHVVVKSRNGLATTGKIGDHL